MFRRKKSSAALGHSTPPASPKRGSTINTSTQSPLQPLQLSPAANASERVYYDDFGRVQDKQPAYRGGAAVDGLGFGSGFGVGNDEAEQAMELLSVQPIEAGPCEHGREC